ncbi:MAG: replicative DNA helicase [Bacteroidaceae bacterium]|nr:replicative DNA helicase [Bacteroidaceae bacterium]
MPDNNRTTRRTRQHEATQEENFGNHLQPQALDLEKAVLGSVMVDHEAFGIVSEILKPESFYDPRHQKIYEAVRELNMSDMPVDMLTVTEKVRSNGQLEEIGGPYYIASLCDTVSGAANIEYYAGIIAQKYMLRQLISFTSKIQSGAFDETTDVAELLQQTEAGIFELTQNNHRKDFVHIDPVIEEAIKMLEDAAKRPDGMSGIASGYTALDNITSGWQKSDLIIIAARPAMGKTAFALSMARNIAADQSIPMALFSLEMSNVQLINRLITNVCMIEGKKIRNGQLSKEEWGRLDANLKKLQGKPLYIDDTPSLSIYELRTKARRLVREHGVKIIMIDYLQLMNASGARFGSRQEEVSTISRTLKGMAKELNIPIIALSQLNRSVEQRGPGPGAENNSQSKRPQLSDLRESGAIEQDADIVIFIHRPEYYGMKKDDQGRDLRGIAEIIVAKHRNGAVADVRLNFKGEYARFENPEDDIDMSVVRPYQTGSKLNDMHDEESMPIPDDDPFGEPPPNPIDL